MREDRQCVAQSTVYRAAAIPATPGTAEAATASNAAPVYAAWLE